MTKQKDWKKISLINMDKLTAFTDEFFILVRKYNLSPMDIQLFLETSKVELQRVMDLNSNNAIQKLIEETDVRENTSTMTR